MTPSNTSSGTTGGAPNADQSVEPGATADLVADAVLEVPGVSGLHGGAFGEVGTYLPGRRVSGVRIGDRTEVHITVAMNSDVLAVVGQVRGAVSTLVGGPVEVVVEDVTEAPR